MAGTTLPVLHSSHFPQVFTAAINQAVNRVCSKPELTLCCYEERIGRPSDNNSQLCNRLAVVHDLDSDLDLCARHFAEVSRG